MSEIEKLNMIAEWQEQHKQLIEDLDNSKKRTTELEAENAELKDDNKVMADNYSKMEQKFYDNLTNAKEIIKLLLWDLRNRSYEPVKDLERAEQFLSDIKEG